MTVQDIHTRATVAPAVTPEVVVPAQLTRRERLEARGAHDIVELLNRHEELRGVHAMADFLDDAVRWSA